MLSVGGCGGEPNPDYLPAMTEFDDVAVAAKCNPDDDSQNCLEPTEKAIRVDDEARLKWTNLMFDEATGTVSFDLPAGEMLDPRFVAGAIIYRGRRDRRPLLHKIDSVVQKGASVAIKVSRAHIKDAFRKGRVRARIPLGAGGPSATSMSEGYGVLSSALSVAIGPKDCSGTVFDQVLMGADVQGKVSLKLSECRFVLTAWVDAVLQWDSIVNLDKVELTVGGSIDAALHAVLVANLSGKTSQSKTIWTGPEVPFVVAGLVLTINPSVIAGFDLSAKANLTVTQGFEYTDSITEGFGWSDRLDWYSIDERTSKFTQFGPTVFFDGNITATPWVKARLDLKAFGIIGGYVAVKGFAEGVITSTAMEKNGGYAGDVCADLSIGVTPSLGAICEIPLVNLTLFDEEAVLGTSRVKLVNDACTPWTGPKIADCDVTSPCCTDGQCPPSSDPGVTVSCTKGGMLNNGLYKYTCKNVYPADWCLPGSDVAGDVVCNDKNPATSDKCVDYHCENKAKGVDEAAQKNVGTGMKTNVCLGADCCFVDSDCADGLLTTVDTCQKADPNAGPNTKGTCQHKQNMH